MGILRNVGLAGGLALLTVLPVRADDWAPSAHCMRPVKPYKFTSQYEVDTFRNEVEAYESCIDRFISQQKEQAKTHLEAAKNAAEEWNRFVSLELR